MLRISLTHTDISICYKSLFLADFALIYSQIIHVSTFTAKNARSVSSTATFVSFDRLRTNGLE